LRGQERLEPLVVGLAVSLGKEAVTFPLQLVEFGQVLGQEEVAVGDARHMFDGAVALARAMTRVRRVAALDPYRSSWCAPSRPNPGTSPASWGCSRRPIFRAVVTTSRVLVIHV